MADIIKKIKIEVEADEAKKELDDIKQSLKTTTDNVNKVAAGFKGVGLAMKAAGIGLIIAGFNLLKDLLMKNAKVVKAVEIVMTALQLTMNKIVDVISSVYTKVMDLTNGMEGTTKVITNLINIGFTPLKIAFFTIVAAAKELQIVWEKLFGEGDVEKIKKLTDEINVLDDKIIQAGKDALQSGKVVVDNVGKMFNEVGTLITTTVDAASKAYKDFNLKATLAEAERIANAKRNYGEIAALAQREADRLERQIEINRQDRDNTNKTYEERRKASEGIISLLDEQEKQLKKVAQAKLDEANATYKLDATAENYTATLEAQTALLKVSTDIEGKRTEQKMASLGLLREEINLAFQLADIHKTNAQKLKDFEASRLLNEEKRLEKQKETAKNTYEIDKALINEKLKNGKLEYAERQLLLASLETLEADYAVKVGTIDDQLTQLRINNRKEALGNMISDERASYQSRMDAIKEQAELELENEALTEEQRLQIKRNSSQQIKDLKNKEAQEQIAIGQQSIDTLRSMDEAFTQSAIAIQDIKLKNGKISQAEYDREVAKIQEKAAKREKAYAVGSAIMAGASAVLNALATPAPWPIPTIMAVMAGVLSAAQIAKIIATPIQAASAGGSPSVPSTPSIPTDNRQVNTAPNTSFNFSPSRTTADTNQPLKTYVLSKDVAKQSQLDRQVMANGTI